MATDVWELHLRPHSPPWRPRTPHHPGVRQHPAPGRAPRPGTWATAWASTRVAAHHGSLAKEAAPVNAEQRLKRWRVCGCWWPPPRSSSASTSATSTWSARSPRPRAIAALPATRRPLGPPGRWHAQGPPVPYRRATTWSNARPCSTAWRRGELDRLHVPRRAAGVYWPSRSSPRWSAPNGTRPSLWAPLHAGGALRGAVAASVSTK